MPSIKVKFFEVLFNLYDRDKGHKNKKAGVGELTQLRIIENPRCVLQESDLRSPCFFYYFLFSTLLKKIQNAVRGHKEHFGFSAVQISAPKSNTA